MSRRAQCCWVSSLEVSLCCSTATAEAAQVVDIPHICHLLYTGRIFKFQILHLKITKIYPKKRKYVIFLRSIWKNLYLTDFFTRAAPVVPVSNMRYGSKFNIFSQKEEKMQINRVKVQKTLNRLMPCPKSTKIHIDKIFLDVPFYLLSYSFLII